MALKSLGRQFCTIYFVNTHTLWLPIFFTGEGTVLWKQGERVISAGSIKVRKDYRLTLVEANSLRITNVDVSDSGKDFCYIWQNRVLQKRSCGRRWRFFLIRRQFWEFIPFLFWLVCCSSIAVRLPLLHVISGNYTCEVEWIGTPISITHKLTVLVPPSIVAVLPGGLGQVDHPIEAREGSQVRLECRAEGIPPPIVRWRSPVRFIYYNFLIYECSWPNYETIRAKRHA